MYAVIVAIALTAMGQVESGPRYGELNAEAPAASSDPSAAGSGVSAPITIGSDAPQPTMSDEAKGADQAADAPAKPPAEPAAAAPSEAPVVAPKTSDLIREWTKAPLSGQLAGVPISLAQCLRGATTRQQQTDRTMGYWDLAAKVTQYYLVLREATELAALEQSVTTPGRQWGEKHAALAADRDLARQSAEVAQMRFHHLLGRSTGTPLPLPADLPHCGQYETQYERIFAQRTDPAAQQLNELLPLKYTELRNQAQLVAEAYDWLQQVSQSRDPGSDGVGLLRAHELVSLRRRALVESVRDYNQDIAAYTELAAPSNVGTERLVAMLIQVSNPTPSTSGRSGVQQASANEEAAPESSVLKRSSESDGASQPSNASQWRQVRRPAFWRLRNREHSILVPRQRLLRRN
jgi:hypothetical protein